MEYVIIGLVVLAFAIMIVSMKKEKRREEKKQAEEEAQKQVAAAAMWDKMHEYQHQEWKEEWEKQYQQEQELLKREAANSVVPLKEMQNCQCFHQQAAECWSRHPNGSFPRQNAQLQTVLNVLIWIVFVCFWCKM